MTPPETPRLGFTLIVSGVRLGHRNTRDLPDVTFDSAWRKASGSYEFRGKAKNGKVREIDIRPDGTVEEIE